MRLRARLAIAAAVLMVSGLVPGAAVGADTDGRPDRCDWTQWGQGATHNGQACVRGPDELRLLAHMVVDPFAGQQRAEGAGLTVHYPAPLADRDGNVFVLKKGGSFVSCDPPGSGKPFPCGRHPENLNRMTWSVEALRWEDGQLKTKWTFESDWKPTQMGFEAMFQSAMSDDHVYVPGAGGTVWQLAKNGRGVRRINPFGDTIDPRAFVSGGITVDSHGSVLYNVIKPETLPDGGSDGHGWLVRFGRNGITRVDYRTLIPGAPGANDLCHTAFGAEVQRPLPPPPQPDGSPTLPPRQPCGSQRAGMNVAPAVGPDGTIFTITRPHGSATGMEYYGYIVALNPDLSLKWATSLRGLFNDGCGVLTPYGNGQFDCRPGATLGIDPTTNLPPAGGVHDFSSASPVVLPDGGVVYGSLTFYNGFRGHLVKLDGRGRYQGSYPFGWDTTPAVYRHDGTYSLILKDNYYATRGPFEVISLDANLHEEWEFANTETRTCERRPDGTITCVDDGKHPNGFEWCISAPAIDRDGTVYGISEDGNLYVIDKTGQQRSRTFLSKTLAAYYTPVSIDPNGRVYAQNNGELYVLGR